MNKRFKKLIALLLKEVYPMKGKQLLALLLVMSMMSGMSPALISSAEITESVCSTCFGICPQCSSSRIVTKVYSGGTQKVPYGGDPELHLVISSSLCLVCSDCGYEGEVHEHKHIYYHSFNSSGICECGYRKVENECQHLNHDNDALYRTEIRTIKDNDQVHEKRNVFTHSCEDCSSLLPDVYSEWYEESHSFVTTVDEFGVENRYCTACFFSMIIYQGRFICSECNSYNVDSPIVRKEITNITESMHLVMYEYRTECRDCGKVRLMSSGSNEYHSFDENRMCLICGYGESGCIHSNHANDTYVDTEYRSINSNTVHEKRDIYAHSCTDCGEPLPNAYTDWSEEVHADDGNGYCWKCKTTIEKESNEECKHEDYFYLYPELKICSWVMDRFTHTYTMGYHVQCRDCNYPWNILDESTTVTEAHELNSENICITCGYYVDPSLDDECTHANENWREEYDPEILPVYEIKDEQNHLVIHTYKRYCKDCGEYVENYTDDGSPEAHDFTNGDSCVCGYVKEACPHATFTDKYDNGALKPIFSNITDTHHDVQNGYMRYCEDCKQYTGETGYFDAVPEAHDFTNGDVCVCGYDRTYCAHTNKTAYYDSSIQPIFENITETQHDVRNGYRMICDRCNEATDETGYFDAVPEEHDFTNGDVCVCGYDRTYCAHTNKTAYYDSSIQPIFENMTETQHDVRNGYQMICDSCNEPTGETGYFDAVPEAHDFTNGDVCVCGYDRTDCAHSAVEGSAVYVRTYFEAEDANTHKAVADDYEYTCSKCHKTFVEKAPRSEDGVEKGIPHAWDDSGKCQSNGCGYGCAHTGEWIKADKPVEGSGKFLKISESQHKRTSVDYEYTCANCGFKEIRTTPEEGEIKAHLMKWLNSRYEISKDGSQHRIVGQKVCCWSADGETHYCYDGNGNRHIEDAKGAWVEHTPNTVSSDKIHVYKDSNVHVVSEGTITYCVCGTWLSTEYDKKGYEENHIDENKDCYCDNCKHLMDIPNDKEKQKEIYFNILNKIGENENPLSDERIAIFVRNLLQNAGFDDTYIDGIIAVVSSSDYPYNMLYLYSIFNYSIKYHEDITVSGLFTPKNNTLNMGTMDAVTDVFMEEHFIETFFHESGHAIDVNAEWASWNQELADKLWADASDIIKKRITNITSMDAALSLNEVEANNVLDAILGVDSTVVVIVDLYWNTVPDNLTKKEGEVFKRVVAQLNKEIADLDVTNALMVTDVLNALSNHTLHDWMVGNHDMDYWYTEEGEPYTRVLAEPWAEFFCAKIMRLEKEDTLNKDYFPTACLYLESLAHQMLEYYRSQSNSN